MREEKSVAATLLAEKGMRLSQVREDIVQLLNEKANVGKTKETPLLSEFSRDLTEAAARGVLDPLVGRDEELARIVQVLCRRTRNNPVLIGEPGVGKTALVEGLANKIVQGDVPVYLADKRILALDISLIVAGTKYRGQFEERLKTIMRELTESHNIIIFIDELHTLVGAGSAEGSLDAANILKPALSRGEIQCIGATTPAEYRKYIEKDRSLERRFQAVKVASPTEEETIQILRGIKDRYEKFHHVTYTDEALEAAVYQSSRYITDRFLPDKAIDLLDEAGSRVKLRDAAAIEEQPEFSRKIRVVVDRGGDAAERGTFFRDEEVAQRENLHIVREHWDMSGPASQDVVKGDIDDVVSKWTGIPITAVKEEESPKLLRMEEELHKRIVSQENAISAVARAIRRTRAGLKNPHRPVGSFLFLGPTGVGKTEVARSLAAFLFGSERALVRFDMSEYMEKHSVSKLIGSPPGYVGHEEGGQLTERVKRNPYSVVLLDEIEKAHPDVFNILLQVFEDGHLTDGLGNTIDFKNTILIMTSNIGARFIEKKGRMGFANPDEKVTAERDERDGDGGGEAHLQPRVHQPRGRDHHLRRPLRRRPHPDHAAPRGAAQREPQGEGDPDQHPRRGHRVAPPEDALRPLLRRAPPAPGHPASHRGRPLGGLHPREHPASASHRGGGQQRRPVVLAGRPGRGAQRMTTTVRRLLAALLLTGGMAASLSAQEIAPADAPKVERIDVLRNQYLSKETLLYYVSTKVGDRYDEFRLREDFRRLWDTGFLDDLLIDVQDGPTGGRIVRFVVQERKRIQIVDYRGSKALTTTAIEDELKKKEAGLKIDTFYDIGKARRVEQILKEMLLEKGRPFATVKHDVKSIGGSGVQVSFTIDEGPKAKVAEVDFVGNTVFSDATLRRQMKKIKQGGFWNLAWLGGKRTYTPEKWSGPEGDQKRVEDFYLNHGYVTSAVGEPRMSYVDLKTGKKPVKGIKLEIPVSEGEQYRVGQIKFEGMTVLKEEGVRPIFKMKTGDVYHESRIKKGFDKLRDIYGSLGYFQWTGRTDRKPDPQKKVVDVTLVMDEDKRYYIGKITFTGNNTTRDKVIRREVYMNEGDVFNTEALKLSIRRINQLGYFKPMEGVPQLGPSELGEDKIDVTFKVEEQNRNQFTFGGGVSGLEGTFINASFSTANFLGLGETFQVSAQSGKRTKNYQIAITEPYLFDRPITAGFDVFKRKLVYQTLDNVVGYTDDRTGASLTVGLPVGRFTRVFANYSYQIINISGLTELLAGQTTTPTTGPVFDPLLFGEEGKRRESTFSPSLVHNTVDNPWTPRSGMKLTLTPQVAGGVLGGTVSYYKPDAELIVYIPHTRKTALGLRGEVAYIRAFGDTTTLPLYQKFFLGGETQIRGYNIRTVGPIDKEKNLALGGNKFALFNAEYYWDVGGPLRFLLFFDAGQAFDKGHPIRTKDFRTSTGAELRFIMPVLNVPFRLIYAFNPNRDQFQPRSTFKFAVGTTF